MPGHPAHIFENPLTLYLLPSTPNKKAATRVATFSEVPSDFEPLYAPQFAGLPGHPAHIFENPLTLYLLPSTPNKKAATTV